MKKILGILIYIHIMPVMFLIMEFFISYRPFNLVETMKTGYGFTLAMAVAGLLGYFAYKLIKK